MVNQNQLLQMAGGFVGGFLAHNLTANNPALISPIIPGTPISKADALFGTLAGISAIGGFIGKQPIYFNVGIGGAAGVIVSKLATQTGFSLSHHVNSAMVQARSVWDRVFPSQAYGVNSAPVTNQNGLRKMNRTDVEAQNAGRMNSYLYSYTPTSKGGFYQGKDVSGAVTPVLKMSDFSYT